MFRVRVIIVQRPLLKAQQLPFYPWLVGIYPILRLQLENLGLVQDREVAYAIVSMLVATMNAFIVSARFIQYIYQRALNLGTLKPDILDERSHI